MIYLLRKARQLLLLFCLALTTTACNLDEFPDLENTYFPNYEGGIAILLVNDTIRFRDFLEDNIEDQSSYSIDENERILFSFLLEQEYETGDDFVKIEDVQNSEFIESPIEVTGVLLDDLEFTIEEKFDFSFPSTGDERLDSVYYSQGNFNFELNTNFPGEIGYLFSTAAFRSLSNGDSIVIDSTIIKPSGSTVVVGNHSIPLSGFKTSLISSNGNPNEFTVSIKANITIKQGEFLTGNEYLNLDLTIADPDFEVIFGYFQEDTFNIESKSINLDFFEDLGGDGIQFESPLIEFTVDNSFGIPATVDFSKVYALYDDGDTIKFSGESLKLIESPELSDFGNIVTSTFTLDKNNSNLREILEDSPNKLVLPLIGYTNLGSLDANFLSSNSRIDLDAKVSIPLKLKVEEFEYEKVFVLEDLSDLDGTKEINLLISTINELPFTGSLDLYLLDEDDVVLDSLMDNIIFSTPTSFDDNDKAITPSEITTEIILSQSLINTLIEAAKMKTVIKIASANSDNGDFVEVFADYETNIKIGLAGDISVDINGN
ncbi:MAG: hypothetical protein ACJA0X_003046 [Cyclobacteriaceae bacterium]